ncbi:AAA family ATPase [Clostridium ganghwense]|uniref:AAA family ATPase n=1 Tax=Clostridium ganghwense TaxID=312089 RepID=A0ABT4CTK9_9CLOT|nr:AAA family ATPase [Clostridium ganghwense]MCY6372411.1 AAA family ATPase [Clostridium ganghwense]
MKTAIDFLVEWTENINWKKYLLNTILKTNEIDVEVTTKEIMDIIKNNKEISLITSLSQHSEQTQLFIKEIKNPVNINALDPEVTCELGKNLNVFYGENGTGKSSYVKVFRKLADNYYTNAKNLNIMSNIYTTDATSDNQNIIISYSYGNIEKYDLCVDINSKQNDLSRINVFDSSSVTPLLNNNLTFSVLPKGLNYFSQLTNLLDSIKLNLQDMINKQTIEQNKIFIDSSFLLIAEDIKTITSSVSNVSKLEEFLKTKYPLSEDIQKEIEKIDININELQSKNPVSIIKILNTQKTKLESLKNKFELLSCKVSTKNIDAINEVVKQYDELLEKEKNYNEKFASKVHHITNVNNEWSNFINTARQYYNSIEIDLPKENDRCIFCGQSLSKEQIDLIKVCFEHINSETNDEKNQIEKKIQSCYIDEIALTLSKEDEQLFNQDKKVFVEKIKSIIILIEKNKKIFKESLDNKKEVPQKCSINFENIIGELVNEINEINSRLDNLGKTNEETTEIIDNLKISKDKLLRKKKIYEAKELFYKWYGYKVNIDFLNNIKNKFKTTSLTKKSKEAFEEIVAEDYTSTFDEYCKFLGVPNVSIKLNPHKGETRRRKYIVKENTKVTEIMSEGEQKAIALAEFVTDLKIRKNYCTTLFDDPVSSFDYKRAEKIANLFYEISKQRQVIVFTHNIMFYYYLYNCCCKNENKENKFFKIDEFDRDNKGLISLSTEGRLETLKQITNKIKNASQRINSKGCLGDVLEQKLKATYSDIRTWCELIVEEGFLKKIIRRYEPDIRFTIVPKITKEFVQYLPDVSNLFNKSCRYMLGHSQPNETQNVKPSKEEFNTDLEFVLKLYEKYKN